METREFPKIESRWYTLVVVTFQSVLIFQGDNISLKMKFLTWLYILWEKQQSLPLNQDVLPQSNFALQNQEFEVLQNNEVETDFQLMDKLADNVKDCEQKLEDIIAKIQN